MSRWIAGLCALAMLVLGSSAATASAAEPYERFQPLFSEVYTGASDGFVNHQQRAAVHHGTGRLYATDVVNDRIRVFDPTPSSATEGAPFGSGDLTDPLGVAVDQETGAVYVSDATRVVKYTSAGVLDALFLSPSVTGPLAFDQAADELVVADTTAKVVRRYSTTGAAVGTPFDGTNGSTAFLGLRDIAVDATGDVIVVDSDVDPALGSLTSRVEQFDSVGQWEQTYGPVPGAATVAVIPATGEVVISGNQDSVNTNTQPTVAIYDKSASDTVVEALAIDGDTYYATIRGIAVDDGDAARLYLVTDVDAAYNGGGGYGNRSIQVYQRPAPAAPEILHQSAGFSYTDADLSARVNPGRLDTTYHFEYGPTTAYGVDTTEKTIPAGEDPVEVRAHIEGLDPGATYHYRVVTSNAVGDASGIDRTFETLTPPAAQDCHNAEIRDEQDAHVVPDCRAWEQVSPVDKNGGDAGTNISYWSPSQISPTGDAAAYTSNDSYADPVQSSGSAYLSARGPDGWSTGSVLPPLRQTSGGGNQNSIADYLSSDLSKSLIWTAEPLTDDSPDALNIYVRDNLTAAHRLVTLNPPANAPPGSYEKPIVGGVSAGFDRVFFQSVYALTSDAPTGAAFNVYEWVAGTPDTLRLASILPGETVASAGAQPGGLTPSGGGSVDHAMSEDGSRLFFSSPPDSANLYVRDNGTNTTEITTNGRFWTATPSGSQVLLIEGVGGSASLQLYDVASDSMTNLSPDDEPADGSAPGVVGVAGASDDLSRVYFVANGRLVQGEGAPGGNNLYLSKDGEISFIATLHPYDQNLGVWGDTGFPSLGQRAVTRDGGKLAFASVARLTDYDNSSLSACPDRDGSLPAGTCHEVYVYDDTNGELSCPSCTGGMGYALLTPPSSGNVIKSFTPFQRPQYNFSADGSRLFFQSTGALVPEDANGVFDVYEWSEGETRLISSGAGQGSGSLFMGTSASGDDAFFTTRDRLVGQDRNNDNDVYTARVGGGLAGQRGATTTPPCSGEGCHGSPVAPPLLPAAGSVTFSGSENANGRSGKATVSKPKQAVGPVATLRVKLPGGGTLRISGPGLRPISRRVGKAGTYEIRVTLSKPAAKRLRKRGRLTVAARVRFTRAGGTPSMARVRLSFRQPTASSDGKGR